MDLINWTRRHEEIWELHHSALDEGEQLVSSLSSFIPGLDPMKLLYIPLY
jgi:hypothetical protein